VCEPCEHVVAGQAGQSIWCQIPGAAPADEIEQSRTIGHPDSDHAVRTRQIAARALSCIAHRQPDDRAVLLQCLTRQKLVAVRQIARARIHHDAITGLERVARHAHRPKQGRTVCLEFEFPDIAVSIARLEHHGAMRVRPAILYDGALYRDDSVAVERRRAVMCCCPGNCKRQDDRERCEQIRVAATLSDFAVHAAIVAEFDDRVRVARAASFRTPA
jgi:hypothetical protein